MGITTNFEGYFELNKPLLPKQSVYLNWLSQTRRVKRSIAQLDNINDPIREAVGLPLGPEGAYFIGDQEPYSLPLDDASVLDSNTPPEGQPGLWCQWIVAENGTKIVWNGVTNFTFM
jgi:hypothetical protein